MDGLVENHFEKDRERIAEETGQALGELSAQMNGRGMFYSGIHVQNAFKIHSDACLATVESLISAYKNVSKETGTPPTPEIIAEAKAAGAEIVRNKTEKVRQEVLRLCQTLNSGPALTHEAARWTNDLSAKALNTLHRELDIWAETEARKNKKPEPQMAKQQPADKRKVFVVHGRNEKARAAMFAFLRSIDLDPIEWSEAIKMTGHGAPYIGDTLDKAMSQAQAVVVLLTGDDLAKLDDRLLGDHEKPEDAQPQARANVLFEAGLALGRFPERTVLVELGPLRNFSDVSGRHTVRMDDTPEKRHDLATRLGTSGCAVKIEGRKDWLAEGRFADAILK